MPIDKLQDIINRKYQLKKSQSGDFIWRDIIQANFPFYEQNWVLQLQIEEIPKEFNKLISINKKIFQQKKFFMVRDIYKFLTKKEISAVVYQNEEWWFQVLYSEYMILLREILIGKHNLSRIIANVLAMMFNPYTNAINKNYKKQIQNFNINNANQEYIKEMQEITKNIYKNIREIGKYAGDLVYWDFGRLKPIKVNLPQNIWEKIKGISLNAVDKFISIEKKQCLSMYPVNIDISMLDEFLWLDKITKGFTILDNVNRKIKVDIYIDFSGSMDTKTKYALGIILSLKKLGIKFSKIYAFTFDLLEISEKSIFEISPSGGTSIQNVLKNIETRNQYSIIISDLEDDFCCNIKNINKVFVILVGSKNQFKLWQNHLNIIYFLDTEVKQ